MTDRPALSPCRRTDAHDAHEHEAHCRPFWCPGARDAEPTVGPRCGNNPRARWTAGDRKAVAAFQAYLELRAASREQLDKAEWVEGDPLMLTMARAVAERCQTGDDGKVHDDPRTIAAVAAVVARAAAGADRIRALSLLEAADFLRDAHFRDGLTVQEIGTALGHTVDAADPMIGSLARDGFTADEIAGILSAPVKAQQDGARS